MPKQILVTGAGGFIGGHLVARLRRDGHKIRAIDIKPLDEWFQRFDGVENVVADLQHKQSCYDACQGIGDIFNLAADMGGMGFIETHKTACMLSVLINTHLLMAARDLRAERYFYSSTACVYNTSRQNAPDAPSLTESDAYPAMPEDGYGWEKLFSERLCRHISEESGLPVRVARLHNVYGPHGTFDGGREKAPAALCRKIIQAGPGGCIEIWGDGSRTRSFMYIDDAIEGILRIMNSDITEPVNLGSADRVSINDLVSHIETVAGYRVRRQYRTDMPVGVHGRASDNTMIRRHLGWEPTIALQAGMPVTYRWIKEKVGKQ